MASEQLFLNMEIGDQVEEWRRLQASYMGKTDEELDALAKESYQLTDVARQALQSEVARRGLQVQLRGVAPAQSELNPNRSEFDSSHLDLVVLQRVWDSAEAQQVKKILDGAGIPSFLCQENLDDFSAFTSGFERGVDIKVRYLDNQRALGVLSRALPADPQETTEYVPVCPKCRSPEIVFQSLSGQEESTSSCDARFNWRCDACGFQWTDEGIEKR